MRILVTGAAGFIGYHLSNLLLAQGHEVSALDAMTDYYDPALKKARLDALQQQSGFSFIRGRVEDLATVKAVFAEHKPQAVVHLAGQVGVRYSLEHPEEYVQSNIVGSFNMIEAARLQGGVQHLLMASTSSSYGANTVFPARETHKADLPLTIYAASKRAAELMGHSYASLYGLPMTFLRFFTVYGPWGRPDMAPMLFLKAILAGKPIRVFNHGKMSRDFTYVTDLVKGLAKLIDTPPQAGKSVGDFDSISPVAPHRVVNIGNADPVNLMDFIRALEDAAGVKANMRFEEMQPGDMVDTSADTRLLQTLTGMKPDTDIRDGVEELVKWYRDFYSDAAIIAPAK